MAESARWYTKEGVDVYTVVGKNGKERPVNVSDARHMDLVPSITSVLRLIRNEGIDRYRMMQYIQAARTAPTIEGESERDMVERIIRDADEHSKKARDFGTDIHRIIEGLIKGENVSNVSDFTENQQLIIFDLSRYIEQNGFKGKTEVVLVNDEFGGRLDFIGETKGCPYFICDWKTQATADKFNYYPEWLYQLGAQWMLAYSNWAKDVHAEMPTRVATLAISTIVPGLIEFKTYTEEELEYGRNAFRAILNAFYILKKMEE